MVLRGDITDRETIAASGRNEDGEAVSGERKREGRKRQAAADWENEEEGEGGGEGEGEGGRMPSSKRRKAGEYSVIKPHTVI